MSRVEARQQAQLRTACDSCSSAKVRCDKRQPTCSRCERINEKCHFGESRKHGRQAWRKRNVQQTTSHASALTPAIWPSPGGRQSGSDEQVTWDPLLEVPFASASNYYCKEFPDFESSDPNDPFSAGSLTTFMINDSGDSSCNAELGPNPIYQSEVDQALLQDSLPSSSETSSLSGFSKHGCEARAVSILNSMQHGKMSHGLTSCATDPADAYAFVALAPSFDRVLSINKAALTGWSELMSCSCAQCPHLIILYTSILSKALFWYRVIATDMKSNSEKPKSTEEPNSSSYHTNDKRDFSDTDPPTVDKFHVTPTTVRIGDLSLDDTEQASLRRMILLRELRNTGSAIRALMEVDREPIFTGADETLRRTVEWSLGGISALENELAQVISIVKQLD